MVNLLYMSEKRIQLEAAATDAVQRSGLHNLSFRTLADAVGVKSSSVHYYFPEKSDLAGALIDGYQAGFADLLAQIDRDNPTAKGKLDAFVKVFEDVLAAEKFCLCGMLAAEVDTLDSQNRAKLSAYFKMLEDWLVAAIETSPVAPQMSARSMALSLLSGLEGAILIDRIEGGSARVQSQRDLIQQLMP